MSGAGRRSSAEVLVLCYHAVSPSWPCGISVTPERLEAQLRMLIERGYHGATFSDAVSAPPAPKTLAVTFDDAFRSVRELAFPILSGLGLPGTVFVPTAKIGAEEPMVWPGIDEFLGGAYEQELVGMRWGDVEELRSAGWEIGSHTRSHPMLTTIDDSALDEELQGSRADLEERLRVPCTSLAYPYGNVDDRVVAAAGAAGYLYGAGLTYEPPIALRWPREGVFYDDDDKRFRRVVSPRIRRLRASRWWPVLDRARRRLRGY
jgi:peptidoglycan/xylan/chitin deacetylase (PgdA/CDA1 family)